MPTSEKSCFRVAVFGLGSIGKRHLQNLKALGIADIIAYDPAITEPQDFVFKDIAQLALTPDEVWGQKPDIALIATPSNLHIPQAIEAAQRNCHLFIEKPLSYSLEGVDTLQQLVKERRLTTLVACNMRFHPGPAKVKELIDEGRIGSVLAARLQTGSYLPGWRPQTDYRQSYSASTEWGGTLFDCIHEIDLALWYFGSAQLVGSAYMTAQSIHLQTDGLAEMILKHESGVISNVHLNFVQRDYRRSCQVIGSEGTLYWDFKTGCVDLYDSSGEISDTFHQPNDWQINDMYMAEMQHLLDCIRVGQDTTNPIGTGLEALAIALACRNQPPA